MSVSGLDDSALSDLFDAAEPLLWDGALFGDDEGGAEGGGALRFFDDVAGAFVEPPLPSSRGGSPLSAAPAEAPLRCVDATHAPGCTRCARACARGLCRCACGCVACVDVGR
jgi:hypothetical protein